VGSWGAMEYIPSPINDSRYTNCMPSAGIMRFTREEGLFFVSDRPGGKGKMDIWCSVINKDGSFGESVNLPFNTVEDDVTHYFNTANQTLFFSSKKPDGLGGLDVYQVAKTETGWGDAEMLKAPINSEFDDYYFFYHNGSNIAYFSSNRPKGFSENISSLS